MAEYTKSCVDCGVINCSTQDKSYPDFCLTTELDEKELNEVMAIFHEDDLIHRAAIASAEVEGEFYCRITRVEEIMEFAKKMNAKKIGIATCVGLINESRIFAKILRQNGFEVYGAACKVGAVEKTEIGVEEKYLLRKGNTMCNPILQAKILNKAKTDLNVVVGLCVGHDSLFYKFSDALVTTLITKDRVLGHNPAAAIYTANSYYKAKLGPRER